jgi:peptide-methionine (S)-S-oxide reductase
MHHRLHALVFVAALLAGIGPAANAQQSSASTGEPAADDVAVATFAGGCFWCMEPPYDKLDGVLSTISGYIGGNVENPTYDQVSAGGTGHTEAVKVSYDPDKVSYEKLLEVYWPNVDPTVKDHQFCDQGSQYRPEIFVHDEEQRRAATASRERIEKTKPFDEPIVVDITDAPTFWPAEEYHQNYYEKNPLKYLYYRTACGRDRRLEHLWGATE